MPIAPKVQERPPGDQSGAAAAEPQNVPSFHLTMYKVTSYNHCASRIS